MKPRRRFLHSAAAMTASMVVPCGPESEARAAQGGSQASAGAAAASSTPMPQLRLGSHQVSRLIVGANPLHGFAHFNTLFSQHMSEWATRERVVEILRDCERHGINTWQLSHHERAMGDLQRYREMGGTIQWILLSHPEIENDHRLIRDVSRLKPIAIVHHGGSAERKRRAGESAKVRDFLKAVRDQGVLAGLSTHDPEFLDQAEAEQWETDLYMTSLYYISRTAEMWRKLLGARPIGEVYLPEDPSRMFAAIKQTNKSCLAYKVLAAGRLCESADIIERAFTQALSNIKPNDGIIVGMYPRFSDQVGENAERVRRICASLRD